MKNETRPGFGWGVGFEYAYGGTLDVAQQSTAPVALGGRGDLVGSFDQTSMVFLAATWSGASEAEKTHEERTFWCGIWLLTEKDQRVGSPRPCSSGLPPEAEDFKADCWGQRPPRWQGVVRRNRWPT